MTQIPLFCPKCENENADWLEQSETCAVCGHTYSTAVRREELSKEQLVPVLDISSTPPSSRIKVTEQKIRVNRFRWDKLKDENDIRGIGIVALVVFGLFLRFAIANLNTKSLPTMLLLFSGLLITLMLFYAFYLALRSDNTHGGNNANAVILFDENKIQVFTLLFGIKSETVRTLFPVEAEYIFYTLGGENSSIRLSSQNRKGSILLIENLHAAEARWLALYMRKYLQNRTIGA